MKMWIRKRLDISTKDLIYGLMHCLTNGSRTLVTNKIQRIWDNDNQTSFICLSVRTGFDLLFQALKFEAGGEVLMSALTIPDMPKIVEAHGLKPIPIDLNANNLGPSLDKLEASITNKTKAIVVAHLFGGIVDLDKIVEITKKHNILVIEDCAQAYYSKTYSGNTNADVSMFSFGTIKTATALGGAILVFRRNDLLANKIRKLHNSYPIQIRQDFFKKTLKYILINFLSSPQIFPLVIKLLRRKGIDYDAYIHTLSRSFPNGNFFEKIRKQPSYPLLKLLLHRIETYNFHTIEARIERGNYLLSNLPQSFKFPGQQAIFQTYWAFPIITNEPQKVIESLRKNGFDVTNKNSLSIVGMANNDTSEVLQNIQSIQNKIVFLPLYAEIPMSELTKMAKCLQKI